MYRVYTCVHASVPGNVYLNIGICVALCRLAIVDLAALSRLTARWIIKMTTSSAVSDGEDLVFAAFCPRCVNYRCFTYVTLCMSH